MDRIIGLAVACALFMVFGWLHRRRAAHAFRSEAHCVVCEGTDLESVAPAVYRCRACGHEGGDGQVGQARSKREAGFRAMDPEQRRKSGKQDLREARTLLLSGLGDIERAQGIVGDSLFQDRRIGSSDRDQALAAGVGLILEACNKAKDAEVKLGISLGVAAVTDPAPVLEEGTLRELGLYSRSVAHGVEASDARVGQEARLAIAQGQALLAAIDGVLPRKSKAARERARPSRDSAR